MELVSQHLCKTLNLGVSGNLFGGTILSWLDEAGGILASKICKTSKMVTLKIDETVFHKPVKEKHIIKIYGEVEKVGTTSITLKMVAKRFDVYAERDNNPEQEEIVCSTKMVFVRVTEEGKKRTIDTDVRIKYNPELLMKLKN